MNPFMNLAMNMIQNNPNVANNPRNKAMIDALRSGDNARGEQIANNLLQTYGVSREEGINQAMQYFGMRK